MGMSKYLHKNAADAFFRIALIVAALTLVGAALILALPAPQPRAVNYVDATREHPPSNLLAYPHFSFFTIKRRHIFQYGQLHLVHRSYKRATPALPHGPDISGLSLVATMPGADKSYAIIRGINGGASSLVTLGQRVRESELVEIATNYVLLVRNDQKAKLSMNSAWDAQVENLMSESGLTEGKGSSFSMAVPADAPGKGSNVQIKGWGVYLIPLSAAERQEMGLRPGRGLKVTRVARKDTGLRQGDLLLSVSGRPVGSIPQVNEILKNKIGKDVFLTIIRKGTPMNVDIKIP
jgi:hypothetical protein